MLLGLRPKRSSWLTSEASSGRESLSTTASELRSLGHDACSVVEVGLSGATDERIRRFAVEDGRVLVTLDADFANVIRFPPEHTPGVVRLKIHPPTEEKIRQAIQRALLLLQNIDLAACLAVVDEYKIRVRR